MTQLLVTMLHMLINNNVTHKDSYFRYVLKKNPKDFGHLEIPNFDLDISES